MQLLEEMRDMVPKECNFLPEQWPEQRRQASRVVTIPSVALAWHELLSH